MSKRRIKAESIENLNRVVDSKESTIPVEGKMDIVMADAYNDSVKVDEHVEEIKKELDNKASDADVNKDKNHEKDEVKTVDNQFTAKLILDESVEDFKLEEDEKVTDGRARKVYDNDEEDDYLDYDMFDFIYGLVTDCWPKPINPLGGRLRKFMYIGSDKYIDNPNTVEKTDGHSQVATSGDSIEVYANNVEDFNDIKAICDLYKFKYTGPTAKRSSARHWNFTFNIQVPCETSGYPMMVEDYFEDLNMTLEDVMPADFCKQYRKRQELIEKEALKLIAERDVEKIVASAIIDAARDSEPLDVHLKKLYADLDAAGLKYQKSKIKKKFLDAFADEEEEEVEE